MPRLLSLTLLCVFFILNRVLEIKAQCPDGVTPTSTLDVDEDGQLTSFTVTVLGADSSSAQDPMAAIAPSPTAMEYCGDIRLRFSPICTNFFATITDIQLDVLFVERARVSVFADLGVTSLDSGPLDVNMINHIEFPDDIVNAIEVEIHLDRTDTFGNCGLIGNIHIQQCCE